MYAIKILVSLTILMSEKNKENKENFLRRGVGQQTTA